MQLATRIRLCTSRTVERNSRPAGKVTRRKKRSLNGFAKFPSNNFKFPDLSINNYKSTPIHSPTNYLKSSILFAIFFYPFGIFDEPSVDLPLKLEPISQPLHRAASVGRYTLYDVSCILYAADGQATGELRHRVQLRVCILYK